MNVIKEINALVKKAQVSSWSGTVSRMRGIAPPTAVAKKISDAELESEYDDRLADFYDETKKNFGNFAGFKRWVSAGRPDLSKWKNGTSTATANAVPKIPARPARPAMPSRPAVAQPKPNTPNNVMPNGVQEREFSFRDDD